MKRARMRVRLGCLTLVLGLTGCVTAEDASSPEEGDDPAFALTLPDDGGWQETLSREISAVETKAEAFIDVSSRLYDLLMAIEGDAIANWAKPVDAALAASVASYGELVEAVRVLEAKLDGPELQPALRLTPSAPGEHMRVKKLLARFKKPKDKATCYADVRGKLLTVALFHDGGADDADSGLAALPQTQRDAIALLDYLRRIAGDVAFVSGTVTDWIAASQHPEAMTLDTLTH